MQNAQNKAIKMGFQEIGIALTS